MFNQSLTYSLASKSPRRRALLTEIGLEFELRIADIEEVWPKQLKLDEVAEYLARLKAKHFLGNTAENELLIAADTVVLVEDRLLGKPKDRNDAKHMLHLLSNKQHKVISAVALLHKDEIRSFSCTTVIEFHPISEAEIEFYIDQYQPYDKAGAYAIQEWIGMIGIKSIKGDYYNVVGLPVQKLYNVLQEY